MAIQGPKRATADRSLILHTKEEAAEILRVRVSWLERRAAARKIPFTMLGGCYMFTDDHLAEIVRLNERAAGSPARAARPTRRKAVQAVSNSNVPPLRPRSKKTPHRAL